MCASEVIIIGSYNSVSPGRHQANIWTNAGILLFGPLGINFNEILIEIKNFQENAFEIVVCKMTSISSQPHWVILHDLPLAIVPPLLPVTDTRNWFRVARHAWSTQFLDHPRVYFGQARIQCWWMRLQATWGRVTARLIDCIECLVLSISYTNSWFASLKRGPFC